MRISISHVSEYTYEGPSAPSVQALRLHPAPVQGQTVLSWTVEAPGIAQAATYIDGFGNRVDLLAAPADLTTIRVVASGEIETVDTGGVAGYTGESLAPGAYLRTNPTTEADAASGGAGDIDGARIGQRHRAGTGPNTNATVMPNAITQPANPAPTRIGNRYRPYPSMVARRRPR